MVAEVLDSGTPVRDVERIVEHADGTRLTVSVNIDPLRNAGCALRSVSASDVNCSSAGSCRLAAASHSPRMVRPTPFRTCPGSVYMARTLAASTLGSRNGLLTLPVRVATVTPDVGVSWPSSGWPGRCGWRP